MSSEWSTPLAFAPGAWGPLLLGALAWLGLVRCGLQRIAPPTAMVVFVFAAFGSLLWAGFFTQDDALLLRRATEHDALGFFFSAAQWNAVSVAFLTPMQILSFELDLFLFGRQPTGFFAHHLAALAVAAVLAWRIAQRFMGAIGAGMAILLWLHSPAVVELASRLMNRHYIEGLIYAALATISLLRAQRINQSTEADGSPMFGGSFGLGMLATGFYALAAASKEIFVPLPLALAVVSAGNSRVRLRYLWPMLSLMVLYLPWRIWMLGGDNLTFAYGGLRSWSLADLSLERWARLAGSDFHTVIVMTVLSFFALAWVGKRMALRYLAVGLLTLAPLVPVLSTPAERYLVLPTLVACCLIVHGFSTCHRRILSVRYVHAPAAALVCCIVWLQSGATARFWADETRHHRLIENHVAFLFGQQSDQVLFKPAMSIAYVRHYAALEGRPPGRYCYDRCSCPSGESVTGLHLETVSLSRSGCDFVELPAFAVELIYDPQARRLRWQFDPPRARFLVSLHGTSSTDGGTPFEAPSGGEVVMDLLEPLSVQVVADLDGARGRSARLVVEPSDEMRVYRWPE